MAESNHSDWRKICAAAATEPDSERLAKLIERLIKALDERCDRHPSPERFGECRQP
jgi:hypothetical protein